ncbi:hypothetical protein H0H92_007339 [Tricholoma furcatifolium]|nr:hypothetical protein H0H92_007339 [Tricholoma furcatifolium]
MVPVLSYLPPMGVYGTSTFFQGEPVTPAAHPVPSSSSCTELSTIANGLVSISTTTAPAASASVTGSATGSRATTGASTGASPTATNKNANGAAPKSRFCVPLMLMMAMMGHVAVQDVPLL